MEGATMTEVSRGFLDWIQVPQKLALSGGDAYHGVDRVGRLQVAQDPSIIAPLCMGKDAEYTKEFYSCRRKADIRPEVGPMWEDFATYTNLDGIKGLSAEQEESIKAAGTAELKDLASLTNHSNHRAVRRDWTMLAYPSAISEALDNSRNPKFAELIDTIDRFAAELGTGELSKTAPSRSNLPKAVDTWNELVESGEFRMLMEREKGSKSLETMFVRLVELATSTYGAEMSCASPMTDIHGDTRSPQQCLRCLNPDDESLVHYSTARQALKGSYLEQRVFGEDSSVAREKAFEYVTRLVLAWTLLQTRANHAEVRASIAQKSGVTAMSSRGWKGMFGRSSRVLEPVTYQPSRPSRA